MGKSEVNAAAHGTTLQKTFGLSRWYSVAGSLLQGRLRENPGSGSRLHPMDVSKN
jgi:hypothetical protein